MREADSFGASNAAATSKRSPCARGWCTQPTRPWGPARSPRFAGICSGRGSMPRSKSTSSGKGTSWSGGVLRSPGSSSTRSPLPTVRARSGPHWFGRTASRAATQPEWSARGCVPAVAGRAARSLRRSSGFPACGSRAALNDGEASERGGLHRGLLPARTLLASLSASPVARACPLRPDGRTRAARPSSVRHGGRADAGVSGRHVCLPLRMNRSTGNQEETDLRSSSTRLRSRCCFRLLTLVTTPTGDHLPWPQHLKPRYWTPSPR